MKRKFPLTLEERQVYLKEAEVNYHQHIEVGLCSCTKVCSGLLPQGSVKAACNVGYNLFNELQKARRLLRAVPLIF